MFFRKSFVGPPVQIHFMKPPLPNIFSPSLGQEVSWAGNWTCGVGEGVGVGDAEGVGVGDGVG